MRKLSKTCITVRIQLIHLLKFEPACTCAQISKPWMYAFNF